MLARIAHRVAQPLQSVALHQPHRARIVMRPDRFAAMPLSGAGQPFSDEVERVVPRGWLERGMTDALVADPAQRHREPLRVVLTLGIARDLGADDAVGVVLRLGAPDAANVAAICPLDLERAGAWAIVRADAEGDIERQVRAPAGALRKNNTRRVPESSR